MKRKILAAILALTLLSAMLIACDSGNTPDETTTPSPETTTPAPETTTVSPETATPAPETTTPAPETTTAAPETTTPEPETTVPEPEPVKSPSDLIKSGKDYQMQMELVNTYEVGGGYTVGQGMCTDGKYAYLIFENQSLSPTMCKIMKIDLATMQSVKVSDPLPLDHGNDVTYNSKTGELLVSHNAPNRTRISRVNIETLTVIEYFEIDFQIYGITYRESDDTYCLGISNSYVLSVVDSNFELIRRWGGKEGYTKQGLDCDDKYIYFSKYKTNCVEVYDWDGNFVTRIAISEQSMELESLYHIGDTFYLNFIKGGKIYLYSAKVVEK